MSPYFFTIAIRKKRGNLCFEDQEYKPDFVIPANHRDWCADPILAEDKGQTFLFYEAVHDSVGRIEVAQIFDDCHISKPTVILSGDHHYSYPFVFRMNGTWYMIPESSSQKEVCLYEAVEFPYHWRKSQILLTSPFVDTTVMQFEGQYYILSFCPQKDNEGVSGRAYRLSLGASIQLEPIAWNEQNALEIRGAGMPFTMANRLIRPAQKSRLHEYGDGLVFYDAKPSRNDYCESCCGTFLAENIKVPGYQINGAHTYCISSKYEVIDIRCRSFELTKIPCSLKRKFSSKLTAN